MILRPLTNFEFFLCVIIALFCGHMIGEWFIDIEKFDLIKKSNIKQQVLCHQDDDCNYLYDYLNLNYDVICECNQCVTVEIEPCAQMCSFDLEVF